MASLFHAYCKNRVFSFVNCVSFCVLWIVSFFQIYHFQIFSHCADQFLLFLIFLMMMTSCFSISTYVLMLLVARKKKVDLGSSQLIQQLSALDIYPSTIYGSPKSNNPCSKKTMTPSSALRDHQAHMGCIDISVGKTDIQKSQTNADIQIVLVFAK